MGKLAIGIVQVFQSFALLHSGGRYPAGRGAQGDHRLTEPDGRIAVINLTPVDVDHVLDVQKSGPLWDILADINAEATSIADELLGKLYLIAGGGLVPSVMEARADTVIGRTLETAPGIAINTAKEPDYKGNRAVLRIILGDYHSGQSKLTFLSHHSACRKVMLSKIVCLE